jgi:hypothetical protein
MKLWEKGKLFGLLNVVDIVVVLVVLAAIVGVVAKTHVLRKMTAKSAVVPVRTVVYIDDILPVEAQVPKAGDVIREFSSGDELGVVRAIQIEDHREKAADAQGNWHMNPVPGRKTLILTLDGSLTDSSNQIKVGTIDVKVGGKITITSDLYSFQGYIIDVETGPNAQGTPVIPESSGSVDGASNS